jgi:hypothetical protein
LRDGLLQKRSAGSARVAQFRHLPCLVIVLFDRSVRACKGAPIVSEEFGKGKIEIERL